MEDEEYKELLPHLLECLESTKVAVLATSERGRGTWATPIYFTYDAQFNFYFMSEVKTRHVVDLRDNPNVSLAIFMPSKDALGFRVGVQIEGLASEVPEEQIEQVYMMRSIRLTGTEAWNKESSGGHVMKSEGWTFVKLLPLSMNYTDRRYYGGQSRKLSIRKMIEASEKPKS